MFRKLLHSLLQRGITPFSFEKTFELFPDPLAMLYFVFCLIQMILFKTYILVHIYAHEFKFVDTCVNIFD